MSKKRYSISDYPEHLNPFYDGGEKLHFWGKLKRSGSFSNSLKDLRSTISFRSFRGSKKSKYENDENVQLRKKNADYPTISRQTLPVYRRPELATSTPLLPRSRFSERLRKTYNCSDDYDSSKNPFENEDEEDFKEEVKPDEYVKRVRRRKRRAPLPPGVKDSSWSLTSVETDVSSYPYSEASDPDVSEIEKPMAEISEILQSFTKEIEKMTDSFNTDSSNLDRKNEDKTSRNECPEIIITDDDENNLMQGNGLVIQSVSITSSNKDDVKVVEDVEKPQHLTEELTDTEIVNVENIENTKPTEKNEPDSEICSVEKVNEKQIAIEKYDDNVETEAVKESEFNIQNEDKSDASVTVVEAESSAEFENVKGLENNNEISKNVVNYDVEKLNKNVEENILDENIANNNTEGIEIKHFSREYKDMKYIDESYTIYDRVPDDYGNKESSPSLKEANNNDNYIPKTPKENKFPVGENDITDQTNFVNNNKNLNGTSVVQNEVDEKPPVPKVRKKKFSKTKLLGFFTPK